MPFIDHNEPWILEAIKREAERTRDLLRKLRHVVEQGLLLEPPLILIAELGRHAAILANGIHQFTIRHDIVDQGGVDHAEYEEVMSFVSNEAQREPRLLVAPAVHLHGPDEYSIYRDELGFSDGEYRDLLTWKQAWETHELDLKAAFDVFSSQVVSELQAARYSIKVEDIVPGVAGVVGIALDIAFFAPTVVVPALVSSCATGIAAIAAKFPDVRRKLLGRGH